MKRSEKLIRALILTASLAFAPLTAQAQTVPSAVPYQGFLADETGTAVTGAVTLTFKAYESIDSGVAMWTENLQVSVVNGAFSVYLGDQNSGLAELIRQRRAQYIGISINNGPELPRQRLGAQPYAQMSYNSYRLEGVSVSELVRTSAFDELVVDVEAAQSSADAAQTTAEARTTETRVQEMIDAYPHLSETQVTTLIDTAITESGATTTVEVTNQITEAIDASGHLTTDAATVLINQLIDARNYLTTTSATDLINQLIDASGHLTTTSATTLINQLIDARGYLSATQVDERVAVATQAAQTAQETAEARTTEAQVQALIDALTILSSSDVETLIDDRGYLIEDEINALISVAITEANGITEADVQALIDGSGHLDSTSATALINQLIDARNYLASNVVDQRIAAAISTLDQSLSQLISTLQTDVQNLSQTVATQAQTITTLQNTITTLQNSITTLTQRIDDQDTLIATNTTNVTNLTNQVNTNTTNVTNLTNEVNTNTTNVENLTTNVTNIQNNGTSVAEILGVSATSSDGKFSFGGQQGVRAATEMCKSTFTDVSTAHLCSSDEVRQAISTGNFNANIDDVTTWAAPNHVELDAETCQNFLYNSGDVAAGTTIKVDINHSSNGGGGNATGPVVFYARGQGCGTARRVLCCR